MTTSADKRVTIAEIIAALSVEDLLARATARSQAILDRRVATYTQSK